LISEEEYEREEEVEEEIGEEAEEEITDIEAVRIDYLEKFITITKLWDKVLSNQAPLEELEKVFKAITKAGEEVSIAEKEEKKVEKKRSKKKREEKEAKKERKRRKSSSKKK